MNEQPLSTAEVAEILGVSPNRVRQLSKEGRLGRKAGKHFIFLKSDVLKFKRIPRDASYRIPENSEV